MTTSVQAANGSGIYQTVGAGSYYLADNSTNRSAGTTNIDPALLADLRQKTTYPPIVLFQRNYFSQLQLESPSLAGHKRRTGLGYHYDPLDYCWNHLNLSNATLTLTNGVAIGVCGTFWTGIAEWSHLDQPGYAVKTQSNWWVTNRFRNNPSSGVRPAPAVTIWLCTPTIPQSDFGSRIFPPWAMPPDTIYLGGGGSFSLVDCQVSAMALYVWDSSYGYVGMTNNVFQRCHLDFGNMYSRYPLNFYNNLCFGGEVDFYDGLIEAFGALETICLMR